MNKKRFPLNLFIFFLMSSIIIAAYIGVNRTNFTYSDSKKIENGIFNLDDSVAFNKKLFLIEGDVEFYWKKLLTPSDFDSTKHQIPDGYIKIPGIWNGFNYEEERIKGIGYATYRFIINVPTDQQYGLRIKEFKTSYTMWINGKLVAHAGKVGTTKEECAPSWKRNECFVESENKQLEVIIQVANFLHRKGGVEYAIVFGSSENIIKYKNNDLIFSSLLLGFLIMLSLYHFILYIFRPKDKSMLIFSSISFFIALRLITTNEILVDIIPNINWLFGVRLEYLSYQIVLPLMYSFFYSFYKDLISKKIEQIVIWVTVLFCFIVIFTPVSFFSYTPLVFQFFLLIIAIYMLVILFIASIQKRDYALIFLTGYIIFFVIIINDMLYYNKYANSGFLIHFGLFTLALSQSNVLSQRFSRAFNSIESLTKELEYYNKQLEETVEERTQQILDQKEEIEEQSQQLAIANENLQELNAFKDSLTQMIVHDLKNPLNIVLNFSENQRVIYAGNQMLNLVQNLLDVQRHEKSNMNLELHETSLSEIINKALYQVNYLIEEKNIDLKVDLQNDIFINVDSEIIIRVIVNLLSNALKFTPSSGSISITTIKNDKNISIGISDSGSGIPENQKELVFQKFGQYMINRVGKSGSTGIGLAFCKMAIEAHKGKIDFHSKLGKGTTFTVDFPLTIDYAMPENKVQAISTKTVSNSFHLSDEEKTILNDTVNLLSDIKIYEISKIKILLSKFENHPNNNIQKWARGVKKSSINGDLQQYKQYLNLEK